MRLRFLLSAILAAACFAAPAVDATALKQKAAARLERLAEKMMPKKDLDEMLGFFGPVTKKYMPAFQQFNAEYLAGTNKLATVKKYLPKANSALNEAKAMKVPAKYELFKQYRHFGHLDIIRPEVEKWAKSTGPLSGCSPLPVKGRAS